MESSDEYVWQRRIHHGVRYQKGAVPFPESVKLGLEFNAALGRREKLNVRLLTNAVMLELCDFAKTVTRSESYFLFDMLNLNFELGVDVDDHLQRYEYTVRVHRKIKAMRDQMRTSPDRLSETFTLPAPISIRATLGLEQSRPHRPKRNWIVDTSVLTNGSRMIQASQNQSMKINGAVRDEFNVQKQTESRVVDYDYPSCRELGVTLTFQPENKLKEKLDPGLVTNGMMLELLDFAEVLCGTEVGILHDLVERNFGRQLCKTSILAQVGKLKERNDACTTAERREAFGKETFSIQVVPMHRKNPDVDYEGEEGLAAKRTDPLRFRDHSYMRPLDFDSDRHWETGSRPQQIRLQPREKKVIRSKGKSEKGRTRNLQDPDTNEATEALNGSVKRINGYRICKEIGLDLDVKSRTEGKTKLDLQTLTRGVLIEIHQYLQENCQRYVPALYEILEHNFDLSSQRHRRVEFAWSIAAQVLALASKTHRKGDYRNRVFELPFEFSASARVKEEEEKDGLGEDELSQTSEITFVREMKPVDIEVEID